MLEIGDSLGVDLGWGLQWALAGDPHVRLLAEARTDTGLSNSAYYDWPSRLASLLSATRPQVVIVFLGANDVQGLSGTSLAYGSSSWDSAYAARVAAVMSEATRAGARVLWVGMPVMGPPSPPAFSPEMAHLDSIYRTEATRHPGANYFSSWRLFETAGGSYNAGTTDVAGSVMPLRAGDGIHLADGGEDMLALKVVAEMRALYSLP